MAPGLVEELSNTTDASTRRHDVPVCVANQHQGVARQLAMQLAASGVVSACCFSNAPSRKLYCVPVITANR